MGSSDIMEAVRVRNIPVYTTVNCPYENVHTVRYYQRRRTVVRKSELVVRTIGNYAIL